MYRARQSAVQGKPIRPFSPIALCIAAAAAKRSKRMVPLFFARWPCRRDSSLRDIFLHSRPEPTNQSISTSLKLFSCSDDWAGEGERICAISVSCLPYSCAFGRPQATLTNRREALPDRTEFSQSPGEHSSPPKVSSPHPAASAFRPGRSNPQRNSTQRRGASLCRRETSSRLRANSSPRPASGLNPGRSRAAAS
jgi:hypothetical protein